MSTPSTPVSPTPFLWFHDNAEKAIEYYCSVFPDSEIDHIERYPDESLDPHFAGMAGKVISASFRLGGRRFGALDGGPMYTFTEAVSFMVECENQADIAALEAAGA